MGLRIVFSALGRVGIGVLVLIPTGGGAQTAEQAAPAVVESATPPEGGKPLILADLGLELLPIPAGTFTMGSPANESGRGSDEGPQTQVTLREFWLGKTEVTQAQWLAVMGKNLSHFKGPTLPVERVSWDEAMTFCRKLTERERVAGRLPEGYAYQLPTEAQWEYACRAGTTGAYAGSLDAMAWYGANSGFRTQPVATKQANAWGLHDMHGNVWEWCLARYANRLPGGSTSEPRGAASGVFRVRRGGGWYDSAGHCRSARRSGGTPDFRSFSLGLRLALTPSP